jgi:CRP-like cAMP-binding protein
MPPSSAPRRSTENKILAALNNAASQQSSSQLERISLAQGKVIYEPETEMNYVYFPETAVFSMLCTMHDGSTVEVGPVGDEGLVGLRLFLGADTSFARVIVHMAGSAMRMRADVLRKELRASTSVMPRLLLRYTQMLLAMTSQSSACNKLHSLEQQLARWLLMMSDYVGDELLLTHELISLTLGVRRAGISDTAMEFKKAGIINYHRGHIKMLDRLALKKKSCECYRSIKDEYDRLYAELPRLAKLDETSRL